MGACGLGGEAGPADRAPGSDVKGLRVLVVEDELMVAMVLEEMLAEIGCRSTGSARTVAAGLAAVASGPPFDVAILDVNLGSEQVFPVADELTARGVPFLFATGFGPVDLAHRYPGRPVLHKPYQPRQLAEALRDVRL